MTTILLMTVVFLGAFANTAGALAIGEQDLGLDDLRTIKNQLNLLMEKRQQEYQQLEKSLYESLKGSTDFAALKEEIQLLR